MKKRISELLAHIAQLTISIRKATLELELITTGRQMEITYPDLPPDTLRQLIPLVTGRELDLQYDYIIPVYQDNILIGNIIITGGTK